MNEKTDDLEMRIAFQEDLLSKLEQAMAAQQKQILSLESRVGLLVAQMKQMGAAHSLVVDTREDNEPPPHY